MKLPRQPERSLTCGGFSLLEMMVALGLLGVFLLLAGEVFVLAVNTLGKTQQHLNDASVNQAVCVRLGRDVWNAGPVQLMNNRILRCGEIAGGQVHWIKWTFNLPGGTCRRTGRGAPLAWQLQPRGRIAKIRFALVPGAVKMIMTWPGGRRIRFFPREVNIFNQHFRYAAAEDKR